MIYRYGPLHKKDRKKVRKKDRKGEREESFVFRQFGPDMGIRL